MSISYPLSLPASPPGFRSFDMAGETIIGVSVSPYTATAQTLEWPGDWWTLRASLPPMTRANAERWISFLLSLRGRLGTFLAGDPMGKTPRGAATGTPKVNGTNAKGSKSLTTKGWTNSITGILKAGDYLQIGTGTTQRLYKSLTDANSDGTGVAVLDIFPKLRETLSDNTSIVVNSAQGIFRLTKNNMQWSVDVARTYGIGIEAVEAL